MKLTKILQIAVLLACTPALSTASDAAPVLKEYARFVESMDAPIKLDETVVEFFSYTCSHCLSSQIFVSDFKKAKPATITFAAYPIASADMPSQLAQYAFAAAKLAGVEDQIHGPLFDRIHKDPRPFESKDAVRVFFQEQALLAKVERYLESAESKALRSRIFDMAVAAKVERTPTFVINGRNKAFWGTDQTSAKFTALLIALAQSENLPVSQPVIEAGCSIKSDECSKPAEKPDF